MSQWRYEVEKRRIGVGEMPDYIQLTDDSVYANEMHFGSNHDKALEVVEVWHNCTSELPTKRISGLYSFDAKACTFGNKTHPRDIMLTRFFPAKRLGRMFPRHKKKQQIVYVA